MKFAAPLIALLLVALACGTSASSRGRMLLGCRDDCMVGYEDNVAKCIAKTKLGEPSKPKQEESMSMDTYTDTAGTISTEFVPPTKTAFELADAECRRLQNEEVDKCKAACKPKPEPKPEPKLNKPDCDEVAKQCSTFEKGTLLHVYCKKEKGC